MGQSCGLCKFGPEFFSTSPTGSLWDPQPSARTNFRKEHGREGCGWPLLARSFIPKNERSEQRTGMWIEVALLLPLFFLLGQNLPSILDRKSSNLLPPESEPTFSIVTNNYKGCHAICSVVHPIFVSQNLLFFNNCTYQPPNVWDSRGSGPCMLLSCRFASCLAPYIDAGWTFWAYTTYRKEGERMAFEVRMGSWAFDSGNKEWKRFAKVGKFCKIFHLGWVTKLIID